METFKKPIFFVIVIVIIAIVSGWVYLDNKKKSAESITTDDQIQISNLTNLDPTDFDSSIKNEFALANAKATEANASYKLASLEVEVGSTLLPETINTRYIYNTAADPKNNWMVTISAVSQNFIRALVPSEDYAGTLTEIDSKMWKYNYVKALQLAEKAGGLDWRNTNTLTGMKISLRNNGDTDNRLVWIVEYQSANGNKIIKLDANTGKVFEG